MTEARRRSEGPGLGRGGELRSEDIWVEDVSSVVELGLTLMEGQLGYASKW